MSKRNRISQCRLLDLQSRLALSPFQLSAKLSKSSRRAASITDAIGYFIAKDMQPISAVEGVGFERLLKVLEPRYEIPSRKTFTERVLPTLYVKVRESVAAVVASAEWYALYNNRLLDQSRQQLIHGCHISHHH